MWWTPQLYWSDAVPIIVWVPSLPLLSPWSPGISLWLNPFTLFSPFFLALSAAFNPVDHSLFSKPSHSFVFLSTIPFAPLQSHLRISPFLSINKILGVLWVSLAIFSWHSTYSLGAISSVPMTLVRSFCWWLPSPNHQPRTPSEILYPYTWLFTGLIVVTRHLHSNESQERKHRL